MSLTNINDTIFNAFFSDDNNNSYLLEEPKYNFQFINEHITESNELDIDSLYNMLIRVNNKDEKGDKYYQNKEEIIIESKTEIQIETKDNKRKHSEIEREIENKPELTTIKRPKTDKVNQEPNVFNFGEIFNLQHVLTKHPKIDTTIQLEYETGKYTLFDHIMKIKCTKYSDSEDEYNYAIYIVDLLYPIVFYSGNVARSLKHLKDESQIILPNNRYNKRAISIKGCLELLYKLKSTKKTRKDSVITYINLIEQMIFEKYPNLKDIVMDDTEINNCKRTYTIWIKHYNELKKYLLLKNQNKTSSEPFSFSVNFENKKLVQWCIAQKSNKTRGLLTNKKIKMLEDIKGWHWGIYSNINNPRSKLRWNFHYEKLKKYLILKHQNIEKLSFNCKDKKINKELYNWCVLQKMNAKRGLITEDKIEQLNKLQGWHWGLYSEK
jgi:hypothetical protein